MPPDELKRLSRIKSKLECRSSILEGIRAFFRQRDFIEVETPLRVPAVAPEQFISPFTSEGWFLSTSPELQMKRLLSAGYDRIFQICHCFRKDERGQNHNPEFTMLEWYRARGDYLQVIRDAQEMVLDLAGKTGCGQVLKYQGQEIDLSLPWPQITVREAFLRWAGWDPFKTFDGQRFDDDLVARVIPGFLSERPTVILDYPPECASLARLRPGSPPVAERAEIFIGGLEIANAYSELTEPSEQAQRFKLEAEQLRRAGKPSAWPQKFLEAVEYLPESSGIALGVDRLVMLFCDTRQIDDVMAFPADLL
ncbi:MAG: tRNA synthetase class [Chloroflexi bacterium]|jgi:elongation factor P--(R)-beta-lysine ligase|nr:tRNA synthetase class [Chloroflexota bacterium]